MDTDIIVALIAAGAALCAAAATWVHGNRQLDAERARSAAELAAARSSLELAQAEARRTMDQQLAAAREQLRSEQSHELRRVLQESRNSYDVELLDRRLDAYQQLFSILKVLSLDGRPTPTQDEVDRLVVDLTTWYTDTGGVVMGRRSRDKLFQLRRELRGVESESRDDEALKLAYPPRRTASELRSRLVKEVLTRRNMLESAEPDPGRTS